MAKKIIDQKILVWKKEIELQKIQLKRMSKNWQNSFNGKLFEKIFLETVKRIDSDTLKNSNMSESNTEENKLNNISFTDSLKISDRFASNIGIEPNLLNLDMNAFSQSGDNAPKILDLLKTQEIYLPISAIIFLFVLTFILRKFFFKK